jgi:SAM-dependent methyltransferase
MTFNSVAGTDYGFLNGKPATPSLLDLFGPWPAYLVVAGTLVAAVWAAMTWPWERARSRQARDGGTWLQPGLNGQARAMGASEALPANHHADHPGFAGLSAVIIGMFLLVKGRANARLAADIADVSATDRVVDIGCGPGGAVREAARRGARATGVDPAPVMLRLARAFTRDTGIRWIEGTAESVPLSDGAATVVWSLATVHHWKDLGSGLGQARRVLVPDGRLVAIERQTKAGATGLASHGWTQQQAESFGAHCRTAGFVDVVVGPHGTGRQAVWAVSARRP